MGVWRWRGGGRILGSSGRGVSWEVWLIVWEREGGTYTAEEMANETYEDSSGAIFVIGVEAFERVRFLVCVEDGEVGNFFEGGFCGWVVVDV